MTFEAFVEYCLGKKSVTDTFPFGPDVLVFKVKGKMFALADVELFESINLKCDPERSIDLRERYPGITPGYHMNKTHWNTVLTDGSVPDKLMYELIDHSYYLIVKSLPKKDQSGLI
ncbi:MmcQ/YjbR family DNA-binding protein [Hyphobacterium sp. CCMP332]|nr:MmcQ/YjbR family DNA-binding protein [Hyphobacterium sp. CCMP332]